MNLLKDRTWSAGDMAQIKGSSMLFGLAVGMSLPKSCRKYVPLLLIGTAVLAIRPLIRFFGNEVHEEPYPFEGADERTPAGENL